MRGAGERGERRADAAGRQIGGALVNPLVLPARPPRPSPPLPAQVAWTEFVEALCLVAAVGPTPPSGQPSAVARQGGGQWSRGGQGSGLIDVKAMEGRLPAVLEWLEKKLKKVASEEARANRAF